MTNELKDRIRNFIVSWDNTIDDANWTTCDLFLEYVISETLTAISLLEETIEEK
jgi:hypothetical protein